MTHPKKFAPTERPNALAPRAADPLMERQLAGFDPAARIQRIRDQAAELGIPLDSPLMLADGGLSLFGCAASPAGLDVRPDISIDDFRQLADTLFGLESSVQLLVGDLLASAEALGYGDITRIAAHYNRDEKTLRNWKYVCSNVTLSLRRDILARFPDAKPLTLGHYSIVAPLPPQTQSTLLSRAYENGWSVSAFRDALKLKPTDPPDATPPMITRHIWNLVGKRRRTPEQTTQLRAHIADLKAWISDIERDL